MAPKAIKFKQTKSGRMGKDPSRPKKPLTSYLAFMKDKRPQLAAKNPGLSVGQLAPKVAAAWKSLSEKDKSKYEKEATKDKARFDKEMSKYTPSAEYMAAKEHYAARKKLAKSAGTDIAQGLPPLISDEDLAELADLRKKCASQQKDLDRKDKKIDELEAKLEKQKEKAAAAKEKAAESKAAKAAAKASKAAAKAAAKPAKAAKPAAKAAPVTGSKRKAPDSKPKYESWVKEQLANPSKALQKAMKDGSEAALAKLLKKKFEADFK